MHGFVPPALTVTQCVVAGGIAGLSMLHLGWWRGGLRRSEAAWTLGWTLVLAGLCLVNGLLGFVEPGPLGDALLFVRFCFQAAAVLISLPAVQSYAQGPPVRLVVLALTLWYSGGAALWLWTDLVYAHAVVGGLPVYGPLATAVDLLPVAVVGVYVVMAVRTQPMTVVGAVVTVAGSLSSAMLITSVVPPTTVTSEVLRGLWVVPVVAGLQLLATTRIAAVRQAAQTRARMRDALARVSNAAWFLRTADQLVERARDECRAVLDDATIDGTVRPLARDRFVTEFTSTRERPWPPDEQAFLRDLGRVVSGAVERLTLTARLNRAAFTDSLTGLNNRHGLERHLSRTLARAEVERTSVALFFCDVEGLRHVNDRRGHAGGDAVLVYTAAHLRAVVGDSGYLSRQGGDEFVVVVDRAGGAQEQQRLARRLREEFSPPGVGTPALTVGVARWEPGDVIDPDGLLRDADLAMLEAKRSHTGVAVYDAALRTKLAEQLALRRALEAGLGEDEIIAHFQPLSNAVTLEVVGLEVLARWRRDGQLRMPADWMPFAEESGLIVEVGRRIFRAARAGMEEFDLPVAVNVAARQLDEPDFVRHVEESWGTDAWDRLTIEVTESALLYDAAHVRASLICLAERGVQIAIDDFGTGYNSLARLGELPLHVLKIDRTFVQEVRVPAGAAVLRAIIALAQAHRLEVVAEGVEHADELMALVEMGVTTVQGHMLGRPGADLPIRGPRAASARTSPVARHLEAVRSIRPAAAGAAEPGVIA